MYSAVFCLATLALGVEVGWQRMPDGGLEYIIQIEPEMLDLLKAGEEIASDIPPSVRGVRSYRITVGKGELPREAVLPPEADLQSSPPPVPEAETLPKRPPSQSSASRSEPALPGTPHTLPPPEGVQPLPGFKEKAAAFFEPSPGDANPDADEQNEEQPQPSEPPKPWLPLSLALAASFGSFGGMLYLGWIAWEYRRRYRTLLERAFGKAEAETARHQIAEGLDSS